MTLLQKTKVSLWAYAAHARASLKLDTISRSDLVRNCSFRTRRSLVLTHSLVGEWSKATFSGTMARNFIFPQSITLSCPRSNRNAVTLPLIHHGSLVLHRGNRRGNSPFCWRSRNQQVPCESLVVRRSLTFLLQRKYPRGAGAGSSLQKKQIC